MLTVAEKGRSPVLVAAAASLLLACEGHIDGRVTGGGPGGGGAGWAPEAGHDASAGGARDAGVDERFPGILDDARGPAHMYDGPVYDGDPSCAPDGSPYEYRVCCEGVPCRGVCELHDGSWQCRCRGARGGCGPYGLVCCGGGCTTGCNDGIAP